VLLAAVGLTGVVLAGSAPAFAASTRSADALPNAHLVAVTNAGKTSHSACLASAKKAKAKAACSKLSSAAGFGSVAGQFQTVASGGEGGGALGNPVVVAGLAGGLGLAGGVIGGAITTGKKTVVQVPVS